ncbi:MAG: DUF3375 domain-containing protein [Succinivibrio sp.]|jgi:hypothetical protein|nr:DUF3375 domain-containing protein [Succinivibrio sp.]
MNFISDFSRYSSLLEINNTWKLLRAKSAPFVISFLKNIFSKEREVPYEYARANLKEFLDELVNKLPPEDKKQSAKDYLREWMDRGWIRELDNKLFMTDAAQKAIEFCDRLENKVVSTSATHLEILQQEVQKLYIQVAEDKRLSLRELNSRIKELQKEKRLINEGKNPELNEYQQQEKIKAVYDMASRLPSDFRKLEEETVDIARKIRVQMIENSQTKGQLLSDVLAQENIQRKTEYGAAYEGFFALICEENVYKSFTKQIDFILSKPIAKFLDKKQQNFLHSLTEVLVTECDRVRKIRNRIDENLRSYLESADYRENQIVTSLISKLEQEAVKFKNQDFNLYTKEMNLSLDKAGVKVSSVESLGQALKVPDKEVTLGSLEEHVNSNTISSDILKQLDTVRLSDVRATIRSLIGKTSQMSVGEIIKKVKLRYGLEEIVAFVRVAREMNKAEVNESEEIVVKVPAQNATKELKVKLPKIVLTSQLVRNSGV